MHQHKSSKVQNCLGKVSFTSLVVESNKTLHNVKKLLISAKYIQDVRLVRGRADAVNSNLGNY